MTPCVEWIYKNQTQVLNYIQDDGIWVVELRRKIGVFREHVNSAGGQVSTVPSLNVSVAPSEGHNRVTPVCIIKNYKQLNE